MAGRMMRMGRGLHTQTGGRGTPISTVFFGSDAFSIPICEALLRGRDKGDIGSVDVVVPRGGGGIHSPLGMLAAEAGCSVLVPNKRKTLSAWHLPGKYDLGVVASFGYFIPPHIYDLFGLGMINVHPSDLPRWRGAAPLHHTLLAGDEETAVCLIDVHKEAFDRGLLLGRTPLALDHAPDYPTLSAQLAAMGGDLVLDAIRDWNGTLERAVDQERREHAPAPSHARKVTRKDAEIVWDTHTALDVDRRLRAFAGPDNLGVHTGMVVGKKYLRVKILEATVRQPVEGDDDGDDGSRGDPGALVFSKKDKVLSVATVDGGWVDVSAVQVEGKARNTAVDFANSYLQRVSSFSTVERV